MCRIGSECSDDFPGIESVVAEQLQNGLFRGFRLRSAGGAFAGEAEDALGGEIANSGFNTTILREFIEQNNELALAGFLFLFVDKWIETN